MADSQRRDLVWQKGAATGWPPDMRLVASYLQSGPNANRIGCFAFDLAEAAEQTGLDEDRLAEIIETLERGGFARFDRPCGWIWIPEILRQHPFADSEEVRRTLGELAAVPREAAFRVELVQLFRKSADRPGPAAATGAARAGGIRDYLKRCRLYMNTLVDTRALRVLGGITVILAILFVVFPAIDLGVAGWFFVPPRSFKLGETWIGRFFDSDIHFGMEWFLPVIVGAFLYGLVRKRPIWNLTPRNFLFVALSIGLGAGLVTNVILKDSWGRARPSQVMEFGGSKQFSPPFMRSTQCDKNCSFVSGDASLAAGFLSFAMIATRYRRRWWTGLSAFTIIVGIMRMGRGSHFLSDVVFAILFTVMIIAGACTIDPGRSVARVAAMAKSRAQSSGGYEPVKRMAGWRTTGTGANRKPPIDFRMSTNIACSPRRPTKVWSFTILTACLPPIVILPACSVTIRTRSKEPIPLLSSLPKRESGETRPGRTRLRPAKQSGFAQTGVVFRLA